MLLWRNHKVEGRKMGASELDDFSSHRKSALK